MRRSAKRGDRPATDAAARASAKPVAPRKPRAAKAPPAAAAAKPAASTARPRSRAAASAKPAAGTANRSARPRTTGEAPSADAGPRVTPQRRVPAAGYAAPDGRAGEPAASAGAELVSTTIQAAAELAQIGLAVGRQTLQSMLDRLPRP